MDSKEDILESPVQAFFKFAGRIFGETCEAQILESFRQASSTYPATAVDVGSQLDCLIEALRNVKEKLALTAKVKSDGSEDVDMTSANADALHSTSTVGSSTDEKLHLLIDRDSNNSPVGDAGKSQNKRVMDIVNVSKSSSSGKMETDVVKAHSQPQTSTSGTDASKLLDPNLVQIRASKAEVERRIAAFINHKQSEVNDLNVREFCCGLPDSESSCARVDAVFVGRAGNSSHLKVTRVFNTQGPQTRSAGWSRPISHQNSGRNPTAELEDSVEERLRNVEEHLSVGRDSKTDMFSRLKTLEERVLFLEGVSPEYFRSGPPPPKRQRPAMAPHSGSAAPGPLKKEYQSLNEINQRIQELQAALQQKYKQESFH